MPNPRPPQDAGGANRPEDEGHRPSVSQAEAIVERAVDAAERSIARRLGQHGLNAILLGLRAAGVLAILAYFVFCTTVLVARYYLLPRIDEWRPRIEAAVAAALRAPVTVSRIDADWQGLDPRLALWNVVLQDQQGRTALVLPQVDVVLSWTSLLAWRPRLHELTIFAPELEVRLQRDHRIAVAGFLIDPQSASADNGMLDWVLEQHRISVRGARVHFVDELRPAAAPAEGTDASGEAFDFTDVELLLTRGLTGHHFALQLRPPAQLAGPLDLRGDFTRPWTESGARISNWRGQLFVQLDDADLAHLDALTHLVPAPARIDEARGALRAWIDFDALRVTRLRADVALTGVAAQLRPDLQPLRLNHLQGRITQTIVQDGGAETSELSLSGVQMDGPDGLRLPPTDLLYRVQRTRAGDASAGEQSHFEANRVVLSDWSRLAARVPLPSDWLASIARTAAAGTLEDVRASWDGPAAPPRNYAVRARFSGVGFTFGGTEPAAADAPGRSQEPGGGGASGAPAGPAEPPYTAENLDGDIDLDQASGTLHLESRKARVRIPPAFGETVLAFDTLNTRVRWSRSPAQTDVDVDLLAASSAEIDFNGAGSLHAPAGAPAHLEASGRIGRALARAVPHYLPRTLAAPARAWLGSALLEGNITNANFQLRGDPARFPFADPKAGEFHAALRLQDGVIDIAPRAPPEDGATLNAERAPLWPLLKGIDADVSFDRNQIVINARHALALSYELSDVTVRLPQIEHADLHLLVEGQGSGSLGELLHFIGTSPVNAMTGGTLASAQGSGASRLRLKLDVPLTHAADSLVDGTIAMRGDDLQLRPDIAPFTTIEGDLQFNQRGVRFAGVTAEFLGGETRVDGDTRPDGAIVVRAIGSATAQGVKRQVEPAFLRRLLEHAHGTFRYGAGLTVQNKEVDLQIDSTLEGLVAELPEPFRKAAPEALPLHIGFEPVPGAAPARDTLRVTLGKAASAELQRMAGEGSMRIERGAIGIGASAGLPERGLLLRIDEPKVDFDLWQKLAEAPASAGNPASGNGPAEEGALDRLIVNTAELTVDGKTLTHVALGATREPDDSWHGDIESDQATGSVRWVGARPGTPGRLTARLAKLAIPEQEKQQVARLLEAPTAEFPALDIVADEFELGGRKLGRLEVQAQNGISGGANDRADAWNLQKLALSNPDGRLNATGAWARDAGSSARRMNVNFTLNYANAGNLLTRFGIADTIRNGTGKLEGEVSWRGTPFSVDYPSLAGKLRMNTDKGELLKADAGAGRLLGVLSLESLGHRLTGDFRDVFAAGVAFDSLSASATIANGTLSTDDFIMKGVNAVMRIKGTTDVSAETYNLEVVVVPQLNADATLAYALVNPAIGLGVFVGQYILRRPIMAALTDVYEVSGPWSDPQVKRLKAETLGAPAPGAEVPAARAAAAAPDSNP